MLNAQQALLNSRVTLVKNLDTAGHRILSVASAVGRLTAHDLHLQVPLYDDTAYYNAVKNKWAGLGDYRPTSQAAEKTVTMRIGQRVPTSSGVSPVAPPLPNGVAVCNPRLGTLAKSICSTRIYRSLYGYGQPAVSPTVIASA